MTNNFSVGFYMRMEITVNVVLFSSSESVFKVRVIVVWFPDCHECQSGERTPPVGRGTWLGSLWRLHAGLVHCQVIVEFLVTTQYVYCSAVAVWESESVTNELTDCNLTCESLFSREFSGFLLIFTSQSRSWGILISLFTLDLDFEAFSFHFSFSTSSQSSEMR